MSTEIEKRLKEIIENMKTNNKWDDMKNLAEELFEDLKSYEIVRKIDLSPNDYLGGSVGLFFTTFSETVSLKIWYSAGQYLFSLFRRIEGTDHQITGVFGNKDEVENPDLDTVRERVLDFAANEIYNRKHKTTIS